MNREERREYQRNYWNMNREEMNQKQNEYRRNKRAGKKYKKATFLEYIIKLLKEDKLMNQE
jgi:hypothetical protein